MFQIQRVPLDYVKEPFYKIMLPSVFGGNASINHENCTNQSILYRPYALWKCRRPFSAQSRIDTLSTTILCDLPSEVPPLEPHRLRSTKSGEATTMTGQAGPAAHVSQTAATCWVNSPQYHVGTLPGPNDFVLLLLVDPVVAVVRQHQEGLLRLILAA